MLADKNTLDIKLVDFGFAEFVNEKELSSKAGTPGYIPPEMFKSSPYTSKGDVFSLGVIFYSVF
jgi:serine/threonine protein kinase